jgi:hypothetical protein
MSDDIHEVYAIKYGHHERKKAENYIGGDPHDGQEPIDYFVWAIKGPSGSFVVDTGFDDVMAKKRGRVITKPIAEGLKAIDVAPDGVKNVIISHLHYDHCGNYDTFPNARFHVQDTEMAYATGRCMCHQHLRIPFEEEDVVAMVRKVFAGRVHFHDGAEAIAPGIAVHKIGGHCSPPTPPTFTRISSRAACSLLPTMSAKCSTATRHSGGSARRRTMWFPGTTPRCCDAIRRRVPAWKAGSRGSMPSPSHTDNRTLTTAS